MLLLPSGEPRWRRLPSGETTAEKPAAVAEVEAEAERHWQHQELMLAAAPQPPPTGQDRLRQCDEGAPIFDSIAEARDVADEELLNLSVYCGVAAREVTGERWLAGKGVGMDVEGRACSQAGGQAGEHAAVQGLCSCFAGGSQDKEQAGKGAPAYVRVGQWDALRRVPPAASCSAAPHHPPTLTTHPHHPPSPPIRLAAGRLPATAGRQQLQPLGHHRRARGVLAAAAGRPGRLGYRALSVR